MTPFINDMMGKIRYRIEMFIIKLCQCPSIVNEGKTGYFCQKSRWHEGGHVYTYWTGTIGFKEETE